MFQEILFTINKYSIINTIDELLKTYIVSNDDSITHYINGRYVRYNWRIHNLGRSTIYDYFGDRIKYVCLSPNYFTCNKDSYS